MAAVAIIRDVFPGLRVRCIFAGYRAPCSPELFDDIGADSYQGRRQRAAAGRRDQQLRASCCRIRA